LPLALLALRLPLQPSKQGVAPLPLLLLVPPAEKNLLRPPVEPRARARGGCERLVAPRPSERDDLSREEALAAHMNLPHHFMKIRYTFSGLSF
jgi:hypothetical protein